MQSHSEVLEVKTSAYEFWQGSRDIQFSSSQLSFVHMTVKLCEINLYDDVTNNDNVTSNINNNSKCSPYNCLYGIRQFLNTVCDNLFNPYSRLI